MVKDLQSHKNLKLMKWMQMNYVFSKTFKKQIFDSCVAKLYKTLLLFFSRNFSQHFSNRPYLNVKIIPAYFCIIKNN